MQFIIKPHVGMEIIRNNSANELVLLGMNSQQVQSMMRTEFSVASHRAITPQHSSDFYENDWIFFDYDAQGKLEAIEFCFEANVLFEGG